MVLKLIIRHEREEEDTKKVFSMTESLSPFPRKDKEIVSAFKGMHRREYYTAMTEEESKH